MSKKKKPTKKPGGNQSNNKKKEMPSTFPFWARVKMDKRRTTLVIDEEDGYNKKTKTRKTQQKRRKYKAEEVSKTNYDKNKGKKRLVYDCGTLDCGNPVDAGKRL